MDWAIAGDRSQQVPPLLREWLSENHEKLSLGLYHQNGDESEELSVLLRTPEGSRQEGFQGRTMIVIDTEQAERLLIGLQRVGFVSEALVPRGLPKKPTRPYFRMLLVVADRNFTTIEFMDREFQDRLWALQAALADHPEAIDVLRRIQSHVGREIEELYYDYGTRPETEAALAVLRSHTQGQPASGEVLAAATRVFSEVDFTGLSPEEVRRRLGPPQREMTIEQRRVWAYSYSDGRVSMFRMIWFDATDRVFGVEALPTA